MRRRCGEIERRLCGVVLSQNTVRVGTVGFPVSKRNLFGRVDVVELSDTFNAIPKSRTGKKQREETPANVSYTVELPKHLFVPPPPGTQLPGDAARYGGFQTSDENLKLFERTVRYADALGADTLVLITPPEFTPAKPKTEALFSFLKTVDRGQKKLVWQPGGPWEIERAADFAAQMDVVPAVDPLRDPPPVGPFCYLRLGPFSVMGSRVGVYDLEQIAGIVQPFEDATVVFDTPRAFDDAKNLKNVLLEGNFAGEDDNDGEYFDEDEEDDDI
jgi:uncharacterized protein YecE (DUF72 family)